MAEMPSWGLFRSVRTVASIALLALVVGGCGGGADEATPAPPDEAVASAALNLLETDASVDVQTGTVAATEVDRVGPGETVRTDQTGVVELTYTDGSLSRLGPDTAFTVVALSTDAESPRIETRLDVGRTWHRVTEVAATDERFTVETSVAIAAVRGTTFSVVCLVAEVCTFTVIDGEVAVVVDGAVVAVLTAGEQLEVGPDGAGEVQQLDVQELRADPWIDANLTRDGTDDETLAAYVGSGSAGDSEETTEPDDGDLPPGTPAVVLNADYGPFGEGDVVALSRIGNWFVAGEEPGPDMPRQGCETRHLHRNDRNQPITIDGEPVGDPIYPDGCAYGEVIGDVPTGATSDDSGITTSPGGA